MKVKLYAGPYHNYTAELPSPFIVALKHEGGHYARVMGGKEDEFFWHDFERPLARAVNNRYVAIQDVPHHKLPAKEESV